MCVWVFRFAISFHFARNERAKNDTTFGRIYRSLSIMWQKYAITLNWWFDTIHLPKFDTRHTHYFKLLFLINFGIVYLLTATALCTCNDNIAHEMTQIVTIMNFGNKKKIHRFFPYLKMTAWNWTCKFKSWKINAKYSFCSRMKLCLWFQKMDKLELQIKEKRNINIKMIFFLHTFDQIMRNTWKYYFIKKNYRSLWD